MDRVVWTRWHGQSGADRVAQWGVTNLSDTLSPVVAEYANLHRSRF